MSAELWLALCLQGAGSILHVPVKAEAAMPAWEAPQAQEQPADEEKEEDVAAESKDSAEKVMAPPKVTLHSTEGQSMTGEICPSLDGRIGLLSPDFIEPLVIRPDELASILFTGTDAMEDSSRGTFEVVLEDGSRLQGDVLEITPETWLLDTNGMGTFRVPATSIVSVDNLGGAAGDGPGLVFRGPTGLAGWGQKKSDKRLWSVEPGRLVAKEPNARLGKKLGLDQARDVTLELRWKDDPHFRLFIGGTSARNSKKAFTVEPWGDTLVAWRDSEEGMQVQELIHGLEADAGCTLRFSTDEEKVTFLDPEGEELAQVEKHEAAGPYLSMISDAPGLELVHISVFANTEGDRPLRRVQAAEITAIEDGGQRFLTATGEIPRNTILGIDPTEPGTPVAETEGDLWLNYGDGRRIGGAFHSVTDDGIKIQPYWSESPIVAEWAGLGRGGIYGNHDEIKRRRSSKSFLVNEGGEVAGELEAIKPSGEIVWNPTIAEGSATLVEGAAKRIVVNRTTAFYVSGRKFPHLMRLRDGDFFRCIVHSIADDTILFSSPFGDQHQIDASLVKAVEFDLRATARFAKLFEKKDESTRRRSFGQSAPVRRETSEGFDADSLERALALPRKYKKRRFEHLVLARNGDFLRTSLLGLSAKGAVYPGPTDVERLVPENRLAAVIWLDPTEDSPEAKKVTARVILDEHMSLSMNLSGTEDGKLIGSSPILGDLRIDLPYVISIELDPEVIRSKSTYEAWVLKPMKEPGTD